VLDEDGVVPFVKHHHGAIYSVARQSLEASRVSLALLRIKTFQNILEQIESTGSLNAARYRLKAFS
jgi:hypothetical protein